MIRTMIGMTIMVVKTAAERPEWPDGYGVGDGYGVV